MIFNCPSCRLGTPNGYAMKSSLFITLVMILENSDGVISSLFMKFGNSYSGSFSFIPIFSLIYLIKVVLHFLQLISVINGQTPSAIMIIAPEARMTYQYILSIAQRLYGSTII